MIDRINAFVTRRFGVGTNVASFVRIHVWVVVFLLLISLVLPSREVHQVGQIWATDLALDSNDPRGFAKSPLGDDRFRIAWITGSEGLLLDTGYKRFLPSLVAQQLGSIDGRRVGIDLYSVYALRIGDIYLALLEAVRSRPDMIVVSLNPVWALNPIATHQWMQLDSQAAVQLLSKPRSWPIAAGLFSPADLAWGAADEAFRPFRDRYYYSERIHRITNSLGPLDRTQLPEAVRTREPSESERILSMPPVDFWFRYRLHTPRGLGADRWARWLETSNRGNGAVNRIMLRAIARELGHSKIPSYVYDAPINSEWLGTSRRVNTAIRGIERQLLELRGDFSAPNILFQPLTASRYVPPIDFHSQDLMHMRRAGPLVGYLAGELCHVVAKVGDGSSCQAQGKGAPDG